ncbi:MAG TPA: DNA polymerase Y family protein [Gammaproteobacteria bacterium]|nr:DNA polymerase Y family protein [Gammaproteobacteria bacterium]
MSRPLPFLDLFSREATTPLPPEPLRAPRKPQLWISTCLPNLPFESLSNAASHGPAVIVEQRQGQARIVAVNAPARHCGIEPGSKLSAARALAGSLEVHERSESRERASLESLGTWSQNLTPIVSIAVPESVLLEVSGSLKLFRDVEAIKAKLATEARSRRFTVRLCAAPTAMAALWLARAAAADVPHTSELPGRVGALPISVTHWPDAAQAMLRDLGVRSLGECLRLPRDGFARRVGQSCLHELDLALGRRVDLRSDLAVPTRWRAAYDLQEETADRELFMQALERLLDRLAGDLRRRQAQVRSVRVTFRHLRRPPTSEDFDLAHPAHERERLANLLCDRIERIALPAPVIAIALSTGPFEAMSLEEADLFAKTSATTAARALLERLRWRFGAAAVHGMGLIPEHRPERAWTKIETLNGAAGAENSQPWRQVRPLWLLLDSLPLSSPEARRYYGGTVQLCSGPERIESGWWDRYDIGRDYYVAVSSEGQRLWVYRQRQAGDWYLHGLFG